MTRPIFASSVSICPDTSLPHFGQCNAPRPIVLPQPRQRFSRRGVGTAGGNGELPFASRLCCCVNRVAGNLGRDAVVHSARATYSAHGATSLRQVGEVSESWEQRRDISRQLPVPVSKKSERRKGSPVIQFSNQASTDGLIVSSRSSAKLPR